MKFTKETIAKVENAYGVDISRVEIGEIQSLHSDGRTRAAAALMRRRIRRIEEPEVRQWTPVSPILVEEWENGRKFSEFVGIVPAHV